LGHDIISDLLLKAAAASIAVSPHVAETFRPYHVRIIENGVDTQYFRYSSEGRREVRARLGIGGEMAFVFAGRWSATKGLDVLLRAADSEILNGLPFKLILMGEASPDEPELVARQISRLSHPTRIIVAGSISTELPKYLSAGDVFVAPSSYEGMPLAFLEAMAVGLPPLASDIPVHRMLVERSGVGWLFRKGDSTELAATMARIMDRGIPSSWPERARATIVQHHEIRSKVREYISAYDEVKADVS
jgi:glycosyltransferase involved in cell wall biosynthesis